MPLKEGDFVLVDYTVYDKESGKILDTTIEERAKEGGIYRGDVKYEPELVILGEGLLLKSVEEEIAKMEEGGEERVELPPEKAFGERDPSKIRVVPARELSRRGIVPRVNEEIELDGQRAVIRAVGGGRVILDFNHPLAGKTLVYELKVVKVVSAIEDKIRELAYRWYRKSIPREEIEVEIEGDCAVITLPQGHLAVEGAAVARRAIVRDVEKYIPEVSKVVFKEEYVIEREERERGRAPGREGSPESA